MNISEEEIENLIEALDFYADPETYFAIGFFPDPPCGDFMNDFSYVDEVARPGKKARIALGYEKENESTEKTNIKYAVCQHCMKDILTGEHAVHVEPVVMTSYIDSSNNEVASYVYTESKDMFYHSQCFDFMRRGKF